MFNSFPVEDITHNFSRFQNEVAEESLKEQGKTKDSLEHSDSEPLKTMTLEGAIQLFSTPSTKTISPEFSIQISKWLHDCLMAQGGKKE